MSADLRQALEYEPEAGQAIRKQQGKERTAQLRARGDALGAAPCGPASARAGGGTAADRSAAVLTAALEEKG